MQLSSSNNTGLMLGWTELAEGRIMCCAVKSLRFQVFTAVTANSAVV